MLLFSLQPPLFFLKSYNTFWLHSPLYQKCTLASWNINNSVSSSLVLDVFFRWGHTSRVWSCCLDQKEINCFEIFNIVELPHLFDVIRIIVLKCSKANLYPIQIEGIEEHHLMILGASIDYSNLVLANLWLFRYPILTTIRSSKSTEWESQLLTTHHTSQLLTHFLKTIDFSLNLISIIFVLNLTFRNTLKSYNYELDPI